MINYIYNEFTQLISLVPFDQGFYTFERSSYFSHVSKDSILPYEDGFVKNSNQIFFL